MEVFYSWKLWLFVITILSGLINFLANFKIANNDLKHIGADLKDVKKDISRIKGKVNSIDKKVAVQTQRVDDLEKAIT